MDKSYNVIRQLRKVLKLYVYCLELYCQYVKQQNKSPTLSLQLTQSLIRINQKIRGIIKEIYKNDAVK